MLQDETKNDIYEDNNIRLYGTNATYQMKDDNKKSNTTCMNCDCYIYNCNYCDIFGPEYQEVTDNPMNNNSWKCNFLCGFFTLNLCF